MARTVREERHTARENEILDVAQTLIYSKGYAQMTIQDILEGLHISKGAFYHYYASKQALLEALVGRMVEQMLDVLNPVVDDPNLPALDKLAAVFETAAAWKNTRIEFLAALIQVWYADDNVLVRDKLSRAALGQFRALLHSVIQQGIDEGVMATDYPDIAGAMAMDLLQGLSTDVVQRLLAWDQTSDCPQQIARSISAYTDAIERVLGTTSGSVHIVDPAIFRHWGEVLSGQGSHGDNL